MTGRRGPLVALDSLVPSVPAELHAVAGYGVDPRSPDRWPDDPLDDDRWRALASLLDEHRLWGLLASGVADGAFAVTDDQAVEVVEAHRNAVGVCLSLDRRLVELAGALDGAGIAFAVLKGAGSALALYDQPAQRLYGDVDLLVDGTDFDRAADLVAAAGGQRHTPDPRPGFVARFGKSATFDLDGAWEVDLHRTFALGPFGLAAGRHDLFAEGRVAVPVGGRSVPAPGPATALIAASLHSVLPSDPRRLVPLRDVAELLRPPRVVAARAVELSVRWGVAVVVAAAVEAASNLYRLPAWSPLQGWAATYEPSARERRWLARHHDQRPAAYLLRTLDEVQALGATSGGAAYLWASLRTASGDDESWSRRLARLTTVLRGRSG
jgi:hypothetical protein